MYEQEATDVMIAAGMVNGMVALPMEITDVDEIAMLDEKPATRTCRIGEGDEIVRGSPPKLQQRTVGYIIIPERADVPARLAASAVSSTSGFCGSSLARQVSFPAVPMLTYPQLLLAVFFTSAHLALLPVTDASKLVCGSPHLTPLSISFICSRPSSLT